MKTMLRTVTSAIAWLVVGLLPIALVHAQSYPTRPIKIIVPFAAGSGTDVVARLTGHEMSVLLGQTVIIENQSTGATVVATQNVARAAPDGYTLFLTTSAHAILPSLHNDLAFDVIKDFSPVMLVCAGPLVLTSNPNFPAKNVKDLIALAKAKPGQINYASSGTGTAPHLAMELLKVKAGINLVHVPYRGGGPAMSDVLAGVVPLYFSAPSTALPHIKAGTALALGQTTGTRSELIKDIPTIAEQGVPGYNMELWYALLGPADLPRPIVDRLVTAMSAALKKDEVKQTLEKLGFAPKPSTPEELGKYIRSEVEQWSVVAKAANLSEQK
ncbi:MAG: tripartite tricarboxylate transporter substrate binding protein [Pseudolabrys sp.]